MFEIRRGRPYPLGATWDGEGVNFALFSQNAEGVTLCLFDGADTGTPSQTIEVKNRTRFIWHVYCKGCMPGQIYGYRVAGPYDPVKGQRFNAAKLLVDPYAHAISGTMDWSRGSAYAYKRGDPRADLVIDTSDDTAAAPKCIVVDGGFDWEGDAPPRIPLDKTILYELHVKGFTARLRNLDPALRGSYAGLGSPTAIEYLQYLGVTTLELLPIHACQPEKFLLDKGLTNYWGYNTLGFSAPDARYSASGNLGQQVTEFKQMVKQLHRAGFEVILDVVYNHTCESNHLGPTLSWRGIDNLNYYWLETDTPCLYHDYTGCGNSPQMSNPVVLRMIADSLRYWVNVMHVDGFRFDLATVLGREKDGPTRMASFFDIVQQDPVLSQVKLIAEPWDVGLGGYQVGNFPIDWAEWNGRYRDTVRRFWKGDAGMVSDMAYRLTGSSDLYSHDGRSPGASINFVTCHDGFTLHDLVSYNFKHNRANLQNNQDGTDQNDSWNCGVEGDTTDPAIGKLRTRQRRNYMATLLLSQGTPMLCAGDEFARTQQGNNNAYCQDNTISWVEWSRAHQFAELLEFTRQLIAFRKAHPVFRQTDFLHGRDISRNQIKDVTWLRTDGQEMGELDWQTDFIRAVGMMLDGSDIQEQDEVGKTIQDGVFLLLLNAASITVNFQMPSMPSIGLWHARMDTSSGWIAASGPSGTTRAPGAEYSVEDHSLVLLEWME